MFASLNNQLSLVFASSAFHSQYNLFGCLGLLLKDWFGLTTITGLFTIVTTFTLSKETSFTSFVLCDLVWGVFTATFTFTEGVAGFWDVDLE